MHLNNLIVSVSFVVNDRRIRFVCNGYGKFEVYQRDSVKGRNIYLGTKGAVELINWVIAGDPVLTLKDGDKVRVCQGGSTQIRIAALCLLESHDKYYYELFKSGKGI